MNAATTSLMQKPIITSRIAGFIDHLRLNDFKIGPKESIDAAELLLSTSLGTFRRARTQLKILLTGSKEEWHQFDDLFEAYWSSHGKERKTYRPKNSNTSSTSNIRQGVWKNHFSPDTSKETKTDPVPDQSGEVTITEGAAAKLVATDQATITKTDFRKFSDPEEIALAEKIAYQLAKAMRNRLSRRYRRSSKGGRLDLRKTIRANQCYGGDPLTLIKKSRPDRPVRIVVFLDVSGSMKTYSQFFLQFVKGLVCKWIDTDAYIFHTKLIRVTDAVREKNSAKAMIKLSLIADGIGSGTKLGKSLNQFNSVYAKGTLNSRTFVLIISDGYDTDPPEHLIHELKRLKRRAPRLIWLNPMLGWRDYEPVTASMSAAMPYIDHFAAANTIDALAAIEPELARL